MRLFIGIPLPPAVVDELSSLSLRLRSSDDSLRWSAPESWHITLQFLGGTSQEQYTCVVARLRELRFTPVPIQLDAIGFFDRAGIFFTDVAVTPALLSLQQSVRSKTGLCGFVPEDRPYHPHITLARSKGKTGKQSLSRLRSSIRVQPRFTSFTAKEFLIYESFLGSAGSRYEIRDHFASHESHLRGQADKGPFAMDIASVPRSRKSSGVYNFRMTLAELARALGAELHGSPDHLIQGVAGIEEAAPEHVTFVANPRYSALARTTNAGAVIVSPDFPEIAAATLRTANPYLAFAKAVQLFYREPEYAPGIHPTAVIHPTAKIGSEVHIGAYAVVSEGVIIGSHATLLPHVVIYPYAAIGDHFFAHAHSIVREHCRLGDHVVLQNGAVIGCDGFGFAKDDTGTWHKIVQSGPAILEDAVEVQANSCVDRASVGETRIGAGVKIDNLAQIGHGSKIGAHTLVCAQVGLAGSSEIGRNAILAGQAGVAGHCKLGDGVIMTAQSGVSHDVPAGKMISGSPAFDNRQWLRSTAIFSRLPEIVKQLQRRDKA